MSTALPPRPRSAPSNQAHIAIVASIYNDEYTNTLVENAKDELGKILPNTTLDIARVPGAFEIPVACELLLSRPNPPQAVIALGLIIRGQTKHAELVAESVTASLQEMAVRHKTPVIHEVLLVENENQAYARCVDEALNRGREAARAVHTMVELINAINPVTTTLPKPNISFTKNAQS